METLLKPVYNQLFNSERTSFDIFKKYNYESRPLENVTEHSYKQTYPGLKTILDTLSIDNSQSIAGIFARESYVKIDNLTGDKELKINLEDNLIITDNWFHIGNLDLTDNQNFKEHIEEKISINQKDAMNDYNFGKVEVTKENNAFVDLQNNIELPNDLLLNNPNQKITVSPIRPSNEAATDDPYYINNICLNYEPNGSTFVGPTIEIASSHNDFISKSGLNGDVNGFDLSSVKPSIEYDYANFDIQHVNLYLKNTIGDPINLNANNNNYWQFPESWINGNRDKIKFIKHKSLPIKEMQILSTTIPNPVQNFTSETQNIKINGYLILQSNAQIQKQLNLSFIKENNKDTVKLCAAKYDSEKETPGYDILRGTGYVVYEKKNNQNTEYNIVFENPVIQSGDYQTTVTNIFRFLNIFRSQNEYVIFHERNDANIQIKRTTLSTSPNYIYDIFCNEFVFGIQNGGI